jgi:hypothetical protein
VPWYTKFREDWFRHSEVSRGDTQTHKQHGHLISLLRWCRWNWSSHELLDIWHLVPWPRIRDWHSPWHWNVRADMRQSGNESACKESQSQSQNPLRLAVYCQSVGLGTKPLETHDQRFFWLNPCGHSPYVTASLTRRWVCLLWICFACVKCVVSTHFCALSKTLLRTRHAQSRQPYRRKYVCSVSILWRFWFPSYIHDAII